MTQTQSARPIRPRRWFASIWATSVFSAAGSAVLQFYNGGAFDVAWMARAMLLMSLPFLMADRMTMLVSARARRIMGRQFRYFVATTYATHWGVMLILLTHDSTVDQAAVDATVFVVMAPLMGASWAGCPRLRRCIRPISPIVTSTSTNWWMAISFYAPGIFGGRLSPPPSGLCCSGQTVMRMT